MRINDLLDHFLPCIVPIVVNQRGLDGRAPNDGIEDDESNQCGHAELASFGDDQNFCAIEIDHANDAQLFRLWSKPFRLAVLVSNHVNASARQAKHRVVQLGFRESFDCF